MGGAEERMKNKLTPIGMLLLVAFILIIIFLGMFISAVIRFEWNNDCFEDFADEFCGSIGQEANDVSGSAWYAWFDCTISERFGTMDVKYYFTEQEKDICLK